MNNKKLTKKEIENIVGETFEDIGIDFEEYDEENEENEENEEKE